MKIPARMMVRIIRQHQMHRVGTVCHQPGQVEVGPDIAIHQHKGVIPQQGQRPANAAGGFQRGAFMGIDDGDAEAPAIAQGGGQPVAQPAGVDHQGVDAGVAQFFDVVLDQRLAAGLQQRLGSVVGEGPHALAVAGGQDHGLHSLSSS